MNEEWREIAGYEDYAVSSEGRVAWRGKIVPQFNDQDGYRLVGLYRKSRRVSRLVCEAFHGPAPGPQYQAAHIDRIRANNNKNNLYWATPQENSLDSSFLRRGSLNGLAKLTESDVIDIRQKFATGVRVVAIHKNYPQVSRSTISHICHGRSWRYA